MSNVLGTALALIAWSAPWNQLLLVPLLVLSGTLVIGGAVTAIGFELGRVVKRVTRRDPLLQLGPIEFTRARGSERSTVGYRLPRRRPVTYAAEIHRREDGLIGMTCRLSAPELPQAVRGPLFKAMSAVAGKHVSPMPPEITAVARTRREVKAMIGMALTIRRNAALGVKDPVAAVGRSFRGRTGRYTVVSITPGSCPNAVIRREAKGGVSFVSFDLDPAIGGVLVREPVKVDDDPDPALVAAYTDAIGQISGLPGAIDYATGLRIVIALLEAGDDR